MLRDSKKFYKGDILSIGCYDFVYWWFVILLFYFTKAKVIKHYVFNNWVATGILPLPDMQLLSEAGKICKENALAYFASYSEALKSFITLRHIAIVAVMFLSIYVLYFNFLFSVNLKHS